MKRILQMNVDKSWQYKVVNVIINDLHGDWKISLKMKKSNNNNQYKAYDKAKIIFL